MLLIVTGFGLLAAEDAVAADKPGTVIVSTSGIPHADVADYTESDLWREGMPKGLNDSWRRALDVAIGQIASEKPDAVLHTGDMVEGRWGSDVDGTGLFGPVDTLGQRKRAIERAARLYYGQNKEWWAKHDLDPYFGVGDHEVGDVGSSGIIPGERPHYDLFPAWRRAWARAFTDNGTKYEFHAPGQHRGTAYATMIDDIGLVTLDPFMRTPGDVYARIGWRQLRWLDDVLDELRNQGARYLIVQCETPALGPNRGAHSSRIILENGRQVWQVLRDNDVDLYLTSEFHRMTTHSDDGATPVQVVHGGQLHRGNMNYLVIEAFDDRMELQLKRVHGRRTGTGQIWATRRKRARDGLEMYPGAHVVGRMTIHGDGSLSKRRGYLRDGLGRMAADKGPPQRLPATIGTPQAAAPRWISDPQAATLAGAQPARATSSTPPPPFVVNEASSSPWPFAGVLWSALPLLIGS